MTDLISSVYVPPVGPRDAKILFVGEAPGQEEVKQREPFVGESGNKLTTCLGRNGISREEVLLANLCPYRPPRNDFRALLGTPQLREGIAELTALIASTRPTVICALGNWPLYFLTGKHGKAPGAGILNWRGSILSCCIAGLSDIKVIPTIHPAAILRDGSYYPTFDQDIRRVKGDSLFPELRLPEREYHIVKSGDEAIAWADRLSKADRLAVDIETFGPNLACVGFAPSPAVGVCFVWSNDWAIRDAVVRLLQSVIPKTFHFGTFDTEFLHALCDLDVVNWSWDTMVGQHIMEPELPRSLAFLTSIYTREPYYKDERKESGEDTKSWGKTTDRDKLWTYNCKDICVTAEIQLAQETELKEGPQNWRDFFNFEMEEVAGQAQHITRSGMLRDEQRRMAIQVVLTNELSDRQQTLNYCAGFPLNANSPKQVQRFLYDVLGLPARKNRKTGKRTADEDALVSLLALCEQRIVEVKKDETKRDWTRKALAVKLITLVRQTRKALSSYVVIPVSTDGRARGIYKVPGTDTGRWSAEKYIDGTGCNPQTFPREPIEVEDADWAKLNAIVTTGTEESLRAGVQEHAEGISITNQEEETEEEEELDEDLDALDDDRSAKDGTTGV